ncbi:hypothetical protein [Desertibacillus haloalkaliphilus]|uniref:hypothetical protein n=1 Tax=Desertibacillus haloalkaliphilus TaxID=1328930 RepID=UPI001C26368B|nr:hypothetical protein [Desertibacillus haloalkaliphilus]MBU8908061.1 hypothetical protein [Desertibacillus haloalkaliphilus]
MKRILLALGEPKFNEILRRHLTNKDGFYVIKQEPVHVKYLDEIIEDERPNMIIFHDRYISSNYEDMSDREVEWLQIVEKLRTSYDDTIRVVFFCERDKGDPFLSELVNRNVLDIFRGNDDSEEVIKQLEDQPRYSRVAKLRTKEKIEVSNEQSEVVDESNDLEGEQSSVVNETTSRDQQEQTINSTNNSEEKMEQEKAQSRPIFKREVVKKVVEKNVIKRELKLNVTNQIEKVIGVSIRPKIILVSSPFSGVGTTFYAHILSRALKGYDLGVNYVENPYADPYTYDRFVGHLRVENYQSIFHRYLSEDDTLTSLNQSNRNNFWVHEGVQLIVKNPNEPNYSEDELEFETFVKVLLSIHNNPFSIVDVGGYLDHPVVKDLIDIADQIHLVFPNDLSRLQHMEESDEERFHIARSLMRNDKTKLIGNHFTPKIQNHELVRELFQDQPIYVIPPFDQDLVFMALVNGKHIFDEMKPDTKSDEFIEVILEQILPKEFIKKKRKEDRSLLKKLFNKRVSLSSDT